MEFICLPIQETYETGVWSLDAEDPLQEGTATHSSILVWRIPRDRGAWQATIHGSKGLQRVRHDWATEPSTELLNRCFLYWTVTLLRLYVFQKNYTWYNLPKYRVKQHLFFSWFVIFWLTHHLIFVLTGLISFSKEARKSPLVTCRLSAFSMSTSTLVLA